MCVVGGGCGGVEPLSLYNEFIDFNLDSIPVQGSEDDWREKCRVFALKPANRQTPERVLKEGTRFSAYTVCQCLCVFI